MFNMKYLFSERGNTFSTWPIMTGRSVYHWAFRIGQQYDYKHTAIVHIWKITSSINPSSTNNFYINPTPQSPWKQGGWNMVAWRLNLLAPVWSHSLSVIPVEPYMTHLAYLSTYMTHLAYPSTLPPSTVMTTKLVLPLLSHIYNYEKTVWTKQTLLWRRWRVTPTK